MPSLHGQTPHEGQSGEEAEHPRRHGTAHIPRCPPALTAFPEEGRVKREGRKGSETPDNARRKKQAERLSASRTTKGQPARHHTHSARAGDMHEQRAPEARAKQRRAGLVDGLGEHGAASTTEKNEPIAWKGGHGIGPVVKRFGCLGP